MLGLTVLWACAGAVDDRLCIAPGLDETEATLSEAPQVASPSPEAAPLAWLFTASGTAPLCADLTVDDGTGPRELRTASAAPSITLPVLGLRAGETVELSWTVTDTRDELIDEGTTTFDTPPLPERFPRFELLAHDPSRQEPGHLLLDVKTPTPDGQDPIPDAAYVVVLDQDFEVIWWLDAGDKVGDVMVGPDGLLWGLLNGNIYRWSWFGEVQDIWRSNPEARSPVAVDAKDFHHEVLPEADGSFWTLSFQLTTVDAYPKDYGDPEVLGPATDVEDSLALRVQPDGTLLERWAMSDVLDTTRIGYGSLDRINKDRYDWVHANALVRDPSDGGLLVSLRHQDAVIKLDSHGQLAWILGSHAGWSESFQDALLTPVGDLAWPYHQHGPQLAADGTLLVFDNGTRGYNPYEAEGAERVDESRVVAYRVDEEDGTVEQLWEYRDTLTGPLYAAALGGVDPLPQTGNILASFGFLDAEGGVENTTAGRGQKSIRLIQVHPDLPEDPAVDLRLYSLAEEEPEGWKSYRAEPLGLLWEIAGE